MEESQVIEKEGFFSEICLDKELIYSNSHSCIYRTRKDGKFYLIKKPAGLNERNPALLRREYELSIGCDHPNIVDIYEYREDSDGCPEMVMEYIDGRTLKDFLLEHPPLKTRNRIFSELLEAVAYLHKRRIVHNDLKPENIMVTWTDNRLKLIDFGLSDNDAHYAIKTPGFSAEYAAPELKNERHSDVRSDIFSLGKILRDISGNKYRGIVRKCTEKSPESRYPGINSLIKAWKNRNRNKNLILILTPVLIILTFLTLFLLNVKVHNDEMAQSLTMQKLVIENQKQELDNLQMAYLAVKDSLDLINEKSVLFEKLKKERIDSFNQGLAKRFKISYDSILNSRNTSEMSEIGHRFINDAKTYYTNFDKIVDGIDISLELYSIFMAGMEKYSDSIQKEMINTMSLQ